MYIQKLDDGSVLLTAPVMIPGVPDCDYDRGEPPLTTDQVKVFAKSHEKYNFVDDEHTLVRGGQEIGKPENSFILDSPTSYELFDGTSETYPAGTWMLTSHLTEKHAIDKALNGEYTGYSPTVRSRNIADSFLEEYQTANKSESDDDIALKNFSQSGLIRNINDPVVLSVSLVKKPCQTHSKFCKCNSGENMSENDSNTLMKIRKILGNSENDEVEALKSQMDSIDDKIDEIKDENAEALKSMKSEIVSEVTDLLKEAFADKSQKNNNNDDDDDDDESNSSEGNNPNDDDSNSSEGNEPTEDDNDEDDDEQNDDDKKKSKKSGSKQGKNHNGNKGSDKSQTVNTYEFLGRNPDGTAKRN